MRIASPIEQPWFTADGVIAGLTRDTPEELEVYVLRDGSVERAPQIFASGPSDVAYDSAGIFAFVVSRELRFRDLASDSEWVMPLPQAVVRTQRLIFADLD